MDASAIPSFEVSSQQISSIASMNTDMIRPAMELTSTIPITTDQIVNDDKTGIKIPLQSFINPSLETVPLQNLTFQSSPLSVPQLIHCSDGVLYPEELLSQPNTLSNDEIGQEVALPDTLIDVYSNLGLVGKLLTSGSLMTIKFFQICRNLGENLIDVLGVARPKYGDEINSYVETQLEEAKRQEELQRMYASWMAPAPPPIGQNIYQYPPQQQQLETTSLHHPIISPLETQSQPLPPPPPPQSSSILQPIDMMTPSDTTSQSNQQANIALDVTNGQNLSYPSVET